MEYVILILCALILAGLATWFLRLEKGLKKGASDKGVTGADSGGKAPRGRPCPLCGSLLARGERVRSVVYPSGKEDRMMEIHGCPHCETPMNRAGQAAIERRCPVCKTVLTAGEVVYARVFVRQNKRQHVHVLGCPHCRR